jgi:hypothetical protein
LAENTGDGLTKVMAEVEKANMAEDIGGQRAEGVDHPEPSAAIPMPGVLAVTHQARRIREMRGAEVPFLRMMQRLGTGAATTLRIL